MMSSYSEVILECSEGLAQITKKAPNNQVPTCPQWSLEDLAQHLAEVQERALLRVELQRDPTEDQCLAVADLNASTDHRLLHSSEALARSLATGDPRSPAWNWTGKDQTVRWMARRQAHEAAIHYFDALLSTLSEEPGDSASAITTWARDVEFCSDGLDEVLNVLIPSWFKPEAQAGPGTLYLHATDSPAEWTVNWDDTGLTVSVAHSEAAATVRGTSSELYLWAWNRLPEGTSLQTFGNSETLESYARLVR